MIQPRPPKIKMQALRELYSGGRNYKPGELFDCTVEQCRQFTAAKSAKVYERDRRTYKRRDMVPEK